VAHISGDKRPKTDAISRSNGTADGKLHSMNTATSPTGALQYGQEGSWAVWEHCLRGRVLHVFDDEYLAQRFAVSISSLVIPFSIH
jgi:hypothetical protein